MKLPYMRPALIATLLCSAVAIACSAPDKGSPSDTGRTARTVDSAGGETADSAHDMAGMDHSKMPGMAKADSVAKSPPANTMAGMDHSNMPGMSKTSPATGRSAQPGSMAGMDHSKMPGMTKAPTPVRTGANAMAGMDHSNMPGMTRAPASTAGAGSAPATEFGASPADEKLTRLVAALVNDSVVQRRIAEDSSLRRAWENAAVRQLILKTPDGM